MQHFQYLGNKVQCIKNNLNPLITTFKNRIYNWSNLKLMGWVNLFKNWPLYPSLFYVITPQLYSFKKIKKKFLGF